MSIDKFIENRPYLKGMILSYLNTALWVRFDEVDNVKLSDISYSSVAQASKECRLFLEKIDYQFNGIGFDEMGHDFYLTRTHQGAGFWDRDYGDFGDLLTKISHEFSDVTPVIGDNGKIYFE